MKKNTEWKRNKPMVRRACHMSWTEIMLAGLKPNKQEKWCGVE